MPLPPRPWPPGAGGGLGGGHYAPNSPPTASLASTSTVPSAAHFLAGQRTQGMATSSNSHLGKHHSAVVGLRPQASFATVRDSMAEMERHLESLESENQRLKIRLIKQVRPLIMQVAFGSNELLQERALESWKRQTKVHRIERMNEAHDQAVRAEKAQTKSILDDIEYQMKAEKARRESLMGQLNHMNHRIEEATADIYTADTKLGTFKQQLSGADNCIKSLRQEAEQVADNVRAEHSAYEHRKNKAAVETAQFSDEGVSQDLIRRPASPMAISNEPAMDHEARTELVEIQQKLSFIFDKVSDHQVDRSHEVENAELRSQLALMQAKIAQSQQGAPVVEGSTGEAPDPVRDAQHNQRYRPSKPLHRPPSQQQLPGTMISSFDVPVPTRGDGSSARAGMGAATGSAPASHVSAAPFGPSANSTPPTSHVASPMPQVSSLASNGPGIGPAGAWVHPTMPQGHRYSSPGPGGPPMLRPPNGMMHIPPPPPHAGPHMRAISPMPTRGR